MVDILYSSSFKTNITILYNFLFWITEILISNITLINIFSVPDNRKLRYLKYSNHPTILPYKNDEIPLAFRYLLSCL